MPVLPVSLTTWGQWSSQHPGTTVLSLDTGHDRDYSKPGTPGAAYYDYFAGPSLMFPGGPGVDDRRLRPKDQVFVAILGSGRSKAYPLAALEEFGRPAVINDAIDDVPIVLITDEGGGVQAFLRGDSRFSFDDDGALRDGEGVKHTIVQAGLRDDTYDDAVLERLPGHVAFWFGYASFRPDGELYTG